MAILRNATFRTFLAVVVAFVAFFPGQKIAISDQWPLYEALRTTAAIVFGIMGAWLALLYPRSLERLLDRSSNYADSEQQKFSKFLAPLVSSTAVLALVLVLGIIREVGKVYAELLAYQEIWRGASFSLLVFLTFLQLWTLVLTLLPTELSREEIADLDARRKHIESLQSRTQRQ